MRPSLRSSLILVGLLSACYAPPDRSVEGPAGPAESSEVVFQAVDAGTGAMLLDRELTVRYLVRYPILLDDARVDRVPSEQPYRIAHDVSADNLVVEVRLEAPSYHRLDTVIAVPRGAQAGPLTFRLARRLDRVAQADPVPSRPAADTPAPSRPAPTRPAEGAANVGAAVRSALAAGDGAFARRDWLAAIEAYQRLPAPQGLTSAYAGQYQQALVRRGTAHINRGEFARALEVLEEAAGFAAPGYATFLRLSQAQCAVGRTEEGRGTLAQLGRELPRMTPTARALVSSLIEYERGVCSHGEFDRASTTRDRVRTGAAAIRELETFTRSAGAISPQPAELQAAVADAERRMEQIRALIRG